MEPITAYDVHADLRAQLHDLSRKLEELEARVWKLKDEFYHHMHDEADDDLKDAMNAVAERANR